MLNEVESNSCRVRVDENRAVGKMKITLVIRTNMKINLKMMIVAKERRVKIKMIMKMSDDDGKLRILRLMIMKM